MINLNHVAIIVENFEWYVELFEKLGMHIQRTKGEAPARQLWFKEGIQLRESKVQGSTLLEEKNIDHISLSSDDIEKTVSIALNSGALSHKKENWFILPNGISVELMNN